MRRMRWLAMVVLAVLAVPASAGAWVQSASYDVPDGGPAACLRPAGVGMATLFGATGARTSTTDLLRIQPGAIVPAGSTTLGWQLECAQPSDGPGAGPLLAAPVWDGSAQVAAVAPVGGAATHFPRPPAGVDAGPVSVAQAPSGAAAVAWMETRNPARAGTTMRMRVVAAIRPPGATAFGAPVAVSAWAALPATLPASPAVGVDDAGGAIVAWSQPREWQADTWVAVSDATGFAPPRRYAGRAAPALAVAPGGRALLVTGAGAVYERAASGQPLTAVSLPDTAGGDGYAVALRDDGAAAIARRLDPGVSVWLRAPGGAFGPRQTAAPEDDDRLIGGFSRLSVYRTGAPRRPAVPFEWDPGALRISLSPTGAVLATWVTSVVDGRRARRVLASGGTLTDGMSPASPVSGLCLDARDAFPLLLDDGRLGVVWSEDAATQPFTRQGITMQPPGRVHLSLPGAAAPAAVPRLSTRYAGPHVVRADAPVGVRVHCADAPCSVRVATSGEHLSDFAQDAWNADTAVLAAGTSRTLSVVPFYPVDHPRLRPAPHPILVSACDATGAVVARQRLRPTLRQRPPARPPAILGARARRSGSDVVVTWRTRRPTRAFFIVWARSPRVPPITQVTRGRGRTHYRALLRDVPRSVRSVDVRGQATEGGPDSVARVRIAPATAR